MSPEKGKGTVYQERGKGNVGHELKEVGGNQLVQSSLGCDKEFRFSFNCDGKPLGDFRQGRDIIILIMLRRSLGCYMESGLQKGNKRKRETS